LTNYSEDRNGRRAAGNEQKAGTRQVEQSEWLPSHCEALKQFVAKGMSYRDAAEVLNARFGTAYTRKSVLGQAWRMSPPEQAGPKPPTEKAEMRFRDGLGQSCDGSLSSGWLRRPPVFQRLERVRLRCVEVHPRHLVLVDLERGDCRYPYGGDEEGEPITFCGRPRRKGSSYCTPHFHLTRNPDVPARRPASAAPLQLVVAV
jgi:GcrA cell cycle regulator